MPSRMIKSPLTRNDCAWRLLGTGLTLTILSIWFVFACIAYDTYRTAWREADLVVSDISLLLGQGIARDIDLYDMSLKAVAKNAANLDIMKLPVSSRNAALFADAGNAPGIGGILLVDKDGKALIESQRPIPPNMNVSERPYFSAQRNGTVTIQPFVSHPLIGQLSQLFSFVLSRPRVSATGAFDGIVCIAIKGNYLADLFAEVNLPPGSMIMMAHRDGTILARLPQAVADIGQTRKAANLLTAIESGNMRPYVGTSAIDGVERLVAYHQLGALPVYVAVGLSTADFLGQWRWRLEIMGLAFVALSAVILCLGVLLGRELNRRTRAERTLSELAATDGLTLIANRRHFDETLQVEWRRAARNLTPLSVLMIDGDFFKAFNDTYGHVEGDQVLRLIADALRHAVARPGDLVARFGGEEFVVLLPNTEQDGAARIAEMIRTAIRDLALPHERSTFGIMTVSIGVASRRPRWEDSSSSLIEAADAALYVAKGMGRDKIVLASGHLIQSLRSSPDPFEPKNCRFYIEV